MLRTCSGALTASVAATARRASENTPPVLPDESSPFCKNICISENRNTCYLCARPALTGGRVAIVTNVGRGMRWTRAGRKTCGAAAYGQAVWSCPLDAGVKFVDDFTSDGG